MQNLALQQCEAALDMYCRKGPFTDLVLKEIQRQGDYLFTPDEMARHLSMSRGSLSRRLREEGSRYQQLRDAETSLRAARLMSVPGVSVEDIAIQLGYAEAACFRRAFYRWFGIAPSRYRRAQYPTPAATTISA